MATLSVRQMCVGKLKHERNRLMAQFEYKIFSQLPRTTRAGRSVDWSDAQKSLNEMTAEGWELVSSNTSAIGLMVFGCGSVEPIGTFVIRSSDFVRQQT